jgi:hypothetical protein
LELVSILRKSEMLKAKATITYVKLNNNQVVNVDPNRAAPVVLIGAVKLVLLAQAADTVGTPELFLVANELEEAAELGVIVLQQTGQEGE